MSNIAAHLACANLVYKKIKNIINDKDKFYMGCILPDLIDSGNSHYKIKGKYYLVPNIEKYKNEIKENKDIKLGYLCHLLLDKYFLDEYVIKNIKNYNKIDLFSANMIYNDYTNINATLVKDFKIDLVYINRIMQELKNNIKVKVEKYDLNVDCINNLNGGKLKFIDINSFEEFIREVSLRIAKELE